MTDEEIKKIIAKLKVLNNKLNSICETENIDFVLENLNKLL